MKKELVDLRNKINGSFSSSSGVIAKHYWRGYLTALRDVALPEAPARPLTNNEFRAFRDALDTYSGSGYWPMIEDDTDIEVIREPSPGSPVLTPCIDFVTKSCEGNKKVAKPILFKDDPRTRIKLGGGD